VASAKPDEAAAFSLLSAQAVRERARRMLEIGLDDKLPNFQIDLGQLAVATELVLATTRSSYPTLDIPFHSRWRHFVVGGRDRWNAIADATHWRDRATRARAELDLAIVSVLLDAGAGPQWRYRDADTGIEVGRSEGLALASLAMFARGIFSCKPGEPLRVDAEALRGLSDKVLREAFQISNRNPLPGIEGRADLLRRLGGVVAARPDIFAIADTPRPGGLFDRLASVAGASTLPASIILCQLLLTLGPIWPSRLLLGGIPLGDCWQHPSLRTSDATNGLVPLHKLSQWLAYSLIEPLQRAGIAVTDIDDLTGLAEYRNGGLFIDSGVLMLRNAADAAREHAISSPLVVEWRALTVALLDRLAEALRKSLKLDAATLPLAKVLEGGSWAAGRAIARQKRPDGLPPLKVISDGTVF
jgi:hypothetical protein